VRVRIAAPPEGLDHQLEVMHAWLDETCGAAAALRSPRRRCLASPSFCSVEQGSIPSPPRPVWLFIDDYIAFRRDIATRNSDRPRWNRVFLKRRVALQHCICRFGRMTRSTFA
jgi:hypothetical protein